MPDTIDSLTAEYSTWLRQEGFGSDSGDAEEMFLQLTHLSPVPRSATVETQLSYLAEFIGRWDRAQERADEHGPRCAQRFHGAAECDCGVADHWSRHPFQ